jgi:hypothetical protein
LTRFVPCSRVFSPQKGAAAPAKPKATKAATAPKKPTTAKAPAKPRVVSGASKKAKVLKSNNGTDMDIDEDGASNEYNGAGSDVEPAVRSKAGPKKNKTVTEQYQKVCIFFSRVCIMNAYHTAAFSSRAHFATP